MEREVAADADHTVFPMKSIHQRRSIDSAHRAVMQRVMDRAFDAVMQPGYLQTEWSEVEEAAWIRLRDAQVLSIHSEYVANKLRQHRRALGLR